MLSYQHGYHAGNFADVLKHVALTRLLAYLKLKDKPFLYLETHSGKGQYNLQDKQALKTQEFKQGIELIWNNRKTLPPLFDNYLQAINKLNNSGEMRLYPGSPFIAIDALRNQDRGYLCELHPREFEGLNQMAHFNKKIHTEHTDGIAMMNALLPPIEKRGLIFIDPSYEIKEEYKDIPAAIKEAYKRFSTGVYCLWYPIVDRRTSYKLIRNMLAINAKSAIKVEFNLTLSAQTSMTGCGLWVINPPYTFADDIKTVLNSLKTYFNPGSSSYIVESY